MNTASPQDHLLLITGLHLSNKAPYIGILVWAEKKSVHSQQALRHQLLAVKLACGLIDGVADARVLPLGDAFDRNAVWNLDTDSVIFCEGKGEVKGKLSFLLLEGV